jgi:hypothetical protein
MIQIKKILGKGKIGSPSRVDPSYFQEMPSELLGLRLKANCPAEHKEPNRSEKRSRHPLAISRPISQPFVLFLLSFLCER